MAISDQITAPHSVMLRKKQAAQYLGMSVDMFERNIIHGVIEMGVKLLPNAENSKILGWSVQKLNRARIRLDGEEQEKQDGFEMALANFNGRD